MWFWFEVAGMFIVGFNAGLLGVLTGLIIVDWSKTKMKEPKKEFKAQKKFKVFSKLAYLSWSAYVSELNALAGEGWKIVAVLDHEMILERDRLDVVEEQKK